MSFAYELNEELIALPLGKTCCRKALLVGLLYNSGEDSNEGKREAIFSFEPSADLACELLSTLYKSEYELEERNNRGRIYKKISFYSKSINSIFDELDGGADIDVALGFRCPECEREFLRGMFLSSAKITDPTKSNHLEFNILKGERLNRLSAFLTERFDTHGINESAEKDGKSRIYYKSNQTIFDLLCYVGAMQAGISVSDATIKRDIRNRENRATNCETSNISRAVAASRKHIEAIEQLKSLGRLEKLQPELQYTAELRISAPEASLTELSKLHDPPITKSGLNRRLTKILEVAEEENNKN